MGSTLRHPVGKTTLSGYLVVKPADESFFRPLPDESGRTVVVLFGEDQRVEARLFRSRGKEPRLKLAYTGEQGATLRSWLKKRFPARRSKSSKVRGVLVLERLDADRFRATARSVSQAEVELLAPSERRYFQGAKPVSILHPAMIDLEDGLRRVLLPAPPSASGLRRAVERSLVKQGWQPVDSVSAGLALDAGLRRAGAQLHLVLAADELYGALLSLAAGFTLLAVDLGVVLVAEDRLAERLRHKNVAPAASLKRAVRDMQQLPFLIRGPICLEGLSTRKEIR